MMFNKLRLHVLLVDDVATDRIVERAILNALGIISIDEAENGNVARFKIENSIKTSNPYDLILTDWNMPQMNGLELTKFLKQDKHFRKTPVILLTGVNEEFRIRQALDDGASDYILKPVDRAILETKLLRFFKPND